MKVITTYTTWNTSSYSIEDIFKRNPKAALDKKFHLQSADCNPCFPWSLHKPVLESGFIYCFGELVCKDAPIFICVPFDSFSREVSFCTDLSTFCEEGGSRTSLLTFLRVTY